MSLVDVVNKRLGELKKNDPEKYKRIVLGLETPEIVCTECGNIDVFSVDGECHCDKCGNTF